MSDAIVILGHSLNNDATIDETLKARLDLGKKLFFDKTAPLIFLSGGIANKTAGAPEAVAMQEYLVKEGIPQECIITERNSLTTIQNARLCAPILKSHLINCITLVSSEYHIKRWYFNPVMLFKLFTGFKIKIETAASK